MWSVSFAVSQIDSARLGLFPAVSLRSMEAQFTRASERPEYTVRFPCFNAPKGENTSIPLGLERILDPSQTLTVGDQVDLSNLGGSAVPESLFLFVGQIHFLARGG